MQQFVLQYVQVHWVENGQASSFSLVRDNLRKLITSVNMHVLESKRQKFDGLIGATFLYDNATTD